MLAMRNCKFMSNMNTNLALLVYMYMYMYNYTVLLIIIIIFIHHNIQLKQYYCYLALSLCNIVSEPTFKPDWILMGIQTPDWMLDPQGLNIVGKLN